MGLLILLIIILGQTESESLNQGCKRLKDIRTEMDGCIELGWLTRTGVISRCWNGRADVKFRGGAAGVSL